MNVFLNAAFSELELLEMENQDLEDIINDESIPEVPRAMAGLRLEGNMMTICMLNSRIDKHIENMPIDILINEINHTSCTNRR
ncbi:hypothetical protein SAMN05192574_101359 [Mucilaginibacter gossypiicola]|uniref:Uncharacterized protein n=1 Tax=Mucilaginibacter gossypiicola TaxID=551995 RepID=A0A1H8A742_9SPHI|nr:hypothetical protein [Mucilaginibacter gossypiicola]SEM65704.1 hypothetical protein SAMN05192574_101359 [Mucilaginibacter gossypiicola]